MNDNPDPKLREVLHAWEVSTRPAPRFNAAVWQRIAAQKEQSAPTILVMVREWFLVQLPKPAYATAVLLLTVVLGGAAANARAVQAREQYRLDSARQYLASIDPMAMTARMSK